MPEPQRVPLDALDREFDLVHRVSCSPLLRSFNDAVAGMVLIKHSKN